MIKLIKAYTLSECLDAMSEQAEGYEGLQRKNIIFCEDRLTLVAERALLRRLGGTFLTEITTFSRFLRGDEKRLTRQGSVMAVGDIMLQLQAEGLLRCFRTAQSVAAGATCIYEQIAQFSASELTPDSLKESVEQLQDEALKNKMRDLALIFERYEAFLRANAYVDEGRYLSILPQYLKGLDGIERTNVFFLCHSSFTAQALKAVRAAIEAAENVVGIFCSGEEEIYTNQAYARFCKVAEEYEAKGVKLYRLNKGEPLEGEAEILRRGLYAPSSLTGARATTDKVHSFAAADKMGEAEYVAVQIRKYLTERPQMRYRDFAVLTSSVEEYALAIKKVFREFDIPYSMDERIPLKRHPLSRFLLAVLAVVRERLSPQSVDSLLKNVFFGNSDGYRNYLLKFGNYRGGARREIKFTGADATEEEQKTLWQYGGKDYLIACRERLLSLLAVIPSEGTGRAYCDGVQRLLTAADTAETLQRLVAAAEDVGTRSYLEQLQGKLTALLDEARALAGERRMSVAEFSTILADGLEAAEIAPNPLRLDAVFVGDIADSRIERIGVLFALGMTDDVPRNSADANLVTDQDKEKLLSVRAAIEPMVEEVNLRNRESVCLNLCTFTDGLHLTYPLGASGEPPVLCEVFRYVRELFCRRGGFPIVDEKRYADGEFAYRCGSRQAAARQLLVEKSEYELRRTDSRREFSSLYEALRQRGIAEQIVYAEVDGRKTLGCAEELFFAGGALSPSTLEGYFLCPYQNFASRGLRLKEREEAAVLAVDTGNFVHALLQSVSGKIETFESEEGFAEYANEVGRALLNSSSIAFAADTLSGVYSSEQLLGEGVTVARAVYRQLRGSGFHITGIEREVATADFKGKLDRVDESNDYVRVIDYKTGSIDDSAGAYYTGRKIQMQLYMSAVRGEKIPAGVFYFPAATSFSDSGEGEFRMSGFLNGDQDALLCGDRQLTSEKKSEFFDAKLTGNERSEKVMDGETFADFLDYGVYVSRGAAQEIRDGFITPSPYKDGCRFCRYGGMCGFQKDTHVERKESRIAPKTIANIAKKHREGNDNE